MAFAQPADDPQPGFGGAVLAPPPRSESGPIGTEDPARLPSGTFDPEAAAAAEANVPPEVETIVFTPVASVTAFATRSTNGPRLVR